MIAADSVQATVRVGLNIVEMRGVNRTESYCPVDLSVTYRDPLNIEYEGQFVPSGAPLLRITSKTVIESARTWFLAADGRLTEVRSLATPRWPVGRFIVTENRGRLARWEFPRLGRFQLTQQNGSITIIAPVLDKSACGLSVWPNASWHGRRQKIEFQIVWSCLDSLDDCAWIAPYPDGARAVICLTDHADFDSPQKTRLIADHFIERDLWMTKSVFPAADLPSQTPWEETGLDNPEYRESIDRLFEHGSEIAPHGLTPKRDAPPIAECKRRLELLRGYGLNTWIDHGTGNYLLSRGGHLGDGLNLETLLDESGVRNYWSYFDVWDNPFGKDACVFAERFSFDIISDLADGSHSWSDVKAREALWFALHEFRNLVGDGNDVLIRRYPWRLASWRTAFEWHSVARRVRRAPFGIYGRDGAVFQQALDSAWVFDTVLLNHLALQLAPHKVDRLIEEGSLVIAHCYMACEHDYARGNVFQRSGGHVSIDPTFVTALDYLADRQASGEIATMSFAQLRQCLELFVRSRLRRTNSGWRVEAPRESPYAPVDGRQLTFALPRRTLMGRQNVASN